MFLKSRISSPFLYLSLFFSLLSYKSFADIYVNVSVDWEGREVSEENVKVMEEFRENYPQVPLLQFLNAAYYTKKDVNVMEVSSLIRRTLRSQDEIGLHIHCWRSLVEASGVTYQAEPSWDSWRAHRRAHGHESGHSVPLWAYKESDIRKMLRKSLEVFENHGFGRPTSFRTGGWMGSRKVLSALVAEGFTLDASSVAIEFLKSSQPVITRWLEHIGYGHISPTSQPYSIETVYGNILEFPNNACLADYMKAEDMLNVFKKNVQAWKENRSEDIFVSIGFHQETARYYLEEVAEALDLMKEFSRENAVPLHYTVNPLKQIK